MRMGNVNDFQFKKKYFLLSSHCYVPFQCEKDRLLTCIQMHTLKSFYQKQKHALLIILQRI